MLRQELVRKLSLLAHKTLYLLTINAGIDYNTLECFLGFSYFLLVNIYSLFKEVA